ncbi:restriction endonuclease subunit S [Pseudotabrizicola algicola]|uniref:Restriction endonuclease subunit S n=1 Tax=Pseudotabrizicola algicola TaxID=2709381 RepID=A0A6B3RT40_9RHOB|nr:restriction endonuclease subunit S [Pseudotabrizicola algicola]NEX48691.1 restriction endonuclease subunit S [Pseudotabrizicola algicola]
MRLADACTIHTGYTARGRLEPAAAGGVLAIQLRDISPEGIVDPERLTRVQLDGLAERYFVRTGDVVFRSRGERNTASALDERLQEPALAVLPLMVLRPKREVVTPEYLAWAINQPPAQRHFDSAARGTNIRMIPRSSLDDLELDVPDIETQGKIVVVDALAERERELTQLAADTRRKMISLLLVERTNSMRPKTRQERTSK